MKILIIGNGFIGRRCHDAWSDSVLSEVWVRSKEDVLGVIDEYKPDAVLNAAGVVGKPNVDWCEDHQQETIQGNTVLPIVIAEACAERGVYLLHIGTGCIFYGDGPHDGWWSEDDFANPVAVYTRSKYAADLVLSTLPNVGIARIRMPIDDTPSPMNLIDKLVAYKKVIDVENSITIIPDMISVFRAIIETRAQGIFHVVNPGVIKHRQIIDMYKELVDPNHMNEWIDEADLVLLHLTKKKRSNNRMSSKKLEEIGVSMRPIYEALHDTLKKYSSIKNNIS